MSEGQATGFPDWRSRDLQSCTLDFYSAFAKRYDYDKRLAYLQVGFGLWAEYHIYDGARIPGQTFPSHAFQGKFLRHMDQCFKRVPWMISIDAANGDYSPIEQEPALKKLSYGLFDDSFLCKKHAQENMPNWSFFGRDRWQLHPAGGEINYYTKNDQKKALNSKGPHGISFVEAAQIFHISFMIANDQPAYQSLDRVKEAGAGLGYKFCLVKFTSDGKEICAQLRNDGIAPLYMDAYLCIDGMQDSHSLKGLLPGHVHEFKIQSTKKMVDISISCVYLLASQSIEFEANIE